MNNSNPILADANVRKAMVSGINTQKVRSQLQYPVVAANEPLLAGQLGYDPTVQQLPFSQAVAEQLLTQNGWANTGGVLTKNALPMQFTMAAADTPDYAQVAQELQRQWAQLGIKVTVHYYSTNDLQNTIIANHAYDILLYGISIGVDPDVFAYWDGSQASLSSQGHLNLSEYKSQAANQALEGARTRVDPTLRAIKYKEFLTAWSSDAPALALYQPNFLYVSRGQVFNFNDKQINNNADRFDNVSQWMIRQRRQAL